MVYLKKKTLPAIKKKKKFDFKCSEYCQLHAKVMQLRHWILHSLSKRHFTGSLKQVKNAVLNPKCILFQMWVGEIRIYWLNWKNLDSQLPICCVSCSLLPSCFSVCLCLQPQIFLVALSSLPSQAPDITQTSYVFVTTVQALCVVLDLFSSLYLWTFYKVRISVE